ncbi:MAG: hypothetical protein JNM72_10735 [Deltaproteobacteria bacterium]|nr:hypothetical protein [Deltaproteobacteria bacterium]
MPQPAAQPAPTTAAKPRPAWVDVLLISALGAVLGGLAGAGVQAEVAAAMRAGGVGLLSLEHRGWVGVAGAGALSGPLSFAALRAAERLRGRRAAAGRLLRLGWGPAVGLGVGLIGAAYGAARVHLRGAIDATARGELGAVQVNLAELGLTEWALFGVLGGGVLSLAVGLVTGWDDETSAP